MAAFLRLHFRGPTSSKWGFLNDTILQFPAGQIWRSTFSEFCFVFSFLAFINHSFSDHTSEYQVVLSISLACPCPLPFSTVFFCFPFLLSSRAFLHSLFFLYSLFLRTVGFIYPASSPPFLPLTGANLERYPLVNPCHGF